MNFGKTIEALKEGKKVARTGWNGKDMFLYYIPGNMYPAVTKIAKETFGDSVPYAPYIAMKTAQGNVSTWVPSISDCLAEDWVIIA